MLWETNIRKTHTERKSIFPLCGVSFKKKLEIYFNYYALISLTLKNSQNLIQENFKGIRREGKTIKGRVRIKKKLRELKKIKKKNKKSLYVGGH